MIINNSGDPWVPFWTGKKSYELLKERGYNVEFKTRPGRGHGWENEDIVVFLENAFGKEQKKLPKETANTVQKIVIFLGIISVMFIIVLIRIRLIKRKKKQKV